MSEIMCPRIPVAGGRSCGGRLLPLSPGCMTFQEYLAGHCLIGDAGLEGHFFVWSNRAPLTYLLILSTRTLNLNNISNQLIDCIPF